MASYSYPVGIFINGTNVDQLARAISIAGLSQTLTRITTDTTNMILTFSGTLTAPDLVILNNIIGTFTPIVGNGLNRWAFAHLVGIGVDGGSLTAGSWVQRPINMTLSTNGSEVSISSNQILVYPGSYLVQILGVTAGVGDFAVRLQNLTNSTTLALSRPETCSINNDGTTVSQINTSFFLIGAFNISTYSVLEVQEMGSTTYAKGMGISSTLNITNNYLGVLFSPI